MPGFNKTGPWGTGSMTGWGHGNCVPADSPMTENKKNIPSEEYPNSVSTPANAQAGFYGLGRGGMPCGCGRGFGAGRGRRLARGQIGFNGGQGRGRF